MKIDSEEYEAWRSHPVTAAVFRRLRELVETRKDLWVQRSWGTGDVDPNALAMLRGQAEGFAYLPEATYEEIFGAEE